LRGEGVYRRRQQKTEKGSSKGERRGPVSKADENAIKERGIGARRGGKGKGGGKGKKGRGRGRGYIHNEQAGYLQKAKNW